MEQTIQNPNICDNCQPIRNYFLSDLGICGLCGKTGECFDAELIAYYQNAGIEDDEFIWLKLPRLRGWSAHTQVSIDAEPLSWSEIEQAIRKAKK
ncbi:hypothetical protein [Shewanella colwelliana]|uniref:hypothetical protein n=1 Tax=Shewanella colwelliana TaxID=23 RepID=UPI003735B12B